jgi:membrane fusion protein, heavy metal efflux system
MPVSIDRECRNTWTTELNILERLKKRPGTTRAVPDRKQRQQLWAAAAVVAALASGLTSCKGPDTNGTAFAKNSSEAQLFTIPPEQMSHVQVLQVQPTTLTRTLRLTGAVAYNAFLTTPVITQVSGPVSRIAVVPGQRVRQGEPMLYVASPDYSQLRTNYLKAKDAYGLAHMIAVRAQQLYDHGAIAKEVLEQDLSAEVQAGGDLVAAEAALKVLGITDPEALIKAPPSFEVPVKAPVSGEVVEQDVSVGQFIQPGSTQCFMISDTGNVWVLVNVYQKDLPYVRAGEVVDIQTDTYPEIFKGKISYVAPSLDPNTRTLQARIDTSNPGGKLKKDMYVVGTVTAGTINDAIAVPDAAILRDSENQPFVYTAYSANQFGRRPVTLGESVNGKTEILSGLKFGERVIGDGSLFLQFANSLQR